MDDCNCNWCWLNYQLDCSDFLLFFSLLSSAVCFFCCFSIDVVALFCRSRLPFSHRLDFYGIVKLIILLPLATICENFFISISSLLSFERVFKSFNVVAQYRSNLTNWNIMRWTRAFLSKYTLKIQRACDYIFFHEALCLLLTQIQQTSKKF